MIAEAPLAAYVAALPKVELHVHLEGSMRPPVLLELARRNGVELPAGDADGLEEWFRFRDFAHFVEIYLRCSSCLQQPEDFQLLARDFVEQQRGQNILWSEVHFTISTHLAGGLPGDEIADALDEVFREAQAEDGTVVRLIPDIVRNVGPEAADRTLEWALENRHRGVIALGLSGFESAPTDPYREHFEVACQEGLHRVAHAGEHGGPDVVRQALDVARAERIGHGVRAIEDPLLVAELAAHAVPLEVCPTSNVCLGVAPDLAAHPLPRLQQAGLFVTLNSDDPPLFGTTLTDEYCRATAAWGWTPEVLVRTARGALEACFAGGEDRNRLQGRFDAALEAAGGIPAAWETTLPPPRP